MLALSAIIIIIIKHEMWNHSLIYELQSLSLAELQTQKMRSL